MARFGVITPPVPGHINPFVALGGELQRRGHEVVFFQMADVGPRVTHQGLGFQAIGQSDHPVGSLPESLRTLGTLSGLAALRFTIAAIGKTTEMICRDAPAAVKAAGVQMMLVDQTEPAGGSVAEYLGLPFVTVCNALALNREPEIPPPFSAWSFSGTALARLRNRVGYAVADALMHPVKTTLENNRRRWGLPLRKSTDQYSSSLAQISQLVPGFDYPRKHLPECFHYVGPLRFPSSRSVEFPWERLDGRPLIYATLGTLQGSKVGIFRCFSEACEGLPLQLVISHGSALTERQAEALSRNALVVPYAPQTELLSRARITITHGGLNTVLDSLAAAVPMVAVPIAFEQPAIAKRVEWSGTGEVIPLRKLNPKKLRAALDEILANDRYAAKALDMARAISAGGGAKTAADIIDSLLHKNIDNHNINKNL